MFLLVKINPDDVNRRKASILKHCFTCVVLTKYNKDGEYYSQLHTSKTNCGSRIKVQIHYLNIATDCVQYWLRCTF